MADPTKHRPPARPSADTAKKDAAAERRLRQKEAVIATQIDLKREAAERRDRKSRS